ncbi:2-hydroxyacid dehydrogenase [Hoeflea prorocentri]|uniref:Glyoxylate/hydroxypyruvate reductase A n=1 Tax=Hoeflea prorocentri TaxID=1922333 RepID=A0A9X3ZGR6_9HYPH|nr:glyoxylate/hydroxypyruvate reductase A [Hoeflea prorocentri]MCY6381057.1 glyoxylate/hydroxypyruvate reductase A [Hoeflea prorocentri]MDA5398857.1 glyoxylate/hydroxypyruvate reductase A [Hoeflea prorocentri]
MSSIIPFVSRIDQSDHDRWLDALRNAIPGCRIEPLDALTDKEREAVRVAIVANPDPADLATMANLEWVHSLWAGVEHIAAELPHDGPRIVRLEDPQMAKAMSEAVLAWTLYLHRDMPRYRRQQGRRLWQLHELCLPTDRAVGVLGMGNLGRASAAKLREQEFDVRGWSRTPRDMAGVETFHGAEGLRNILQLSDIIVILLPLTEQTRGLLDSAALLEMKAGASLINFARGPILDSTVLLDRLDGGHIDHAVLDVFDEEPLPEESPFWTHPSVTVLPHISAPTNRVTASAIVAANISAYFETGLVPRGVDRAKGY